MDNTSKNMETTIEELKDEVLTISKVTFPYTCLLIHWEKA